MKVLVTAPWREAAVGELKAAFPGLTFAIARSEQEALREIPEAEVVFGHLSPAEFAAARRLKWVQYQGAGVDWMRQVPAMVESEIAVTCTKGAHADTIAEHVFGLLIALARGFPALYRAQQKRIWTRPLEKPAVGLSGLTMGILGLGRIGRALAPRAKAFGMRVAAVDIAKPAAEGPIDSAWGMEGLQEFLAVTDALVVTAPLTDRTRDMLGPRELAAMKTGAWLIAVSRGGIVDEQALADCLRAGKLAGAALDVQVQKPVPPESALWDAPNLIITPHCAGESRQTDENVLAICRQNLENYLAGRPFINLVDKRMGF